MAATNSRWSVTLFFILVACLGGCKTAVQGQPSYSLAQGCYAIKAAEDGRYIIAGHDQYALSSVGEPEAEKVLCQAFRPGTFCCMTVKEVFFRNDFIHVQREWQASQKSGMAHQRSCNISRQNQIDQQYTLVSTPDELRLLTSKNGLIVQAIHHHSGEKCKL